MTGARTPEDLETLLEDALLMRCADTIAGLFVDGGVLATHDQRPQRGKAHIAQTALSIWPEGSGYVAHPTSIVQARHVALVISGSGINVALRDSAGEWRYAIVMTVCQKEEG